MKADSVFGKRILLFPILFLSLIVLSGGVHSQEVPQAPAESPLAGETGSDDEDAPMEEKLTEEELYARTLSIDITTADYSELVDWCRRLGLDTAGAKTTLQKRLADHYRIRFTSEPAKPSREGRITIVSADDLRYYTDEATDESYVIFNGGVEIEVTDADNGSTHTVRADRVVYNQTRKLLHAEGNVEYVLAGKTETNIFTGESLSFSIDTYEGNFREGVSQKESSLEDKKITFFFSGSVIERSEGNVITLEDGIITSCEQDFPHYMIKAKKIWVLAPGEWGILDAVLYMGRVPVFYIPFFFKPGDEFFFHPVVGSREREGYFVQTTSYLYGRRKQADSSFSFLQITESDTGSYELKREGLFLTKVSTQEKKNLSEDYLKILFDVYSRLGFYGGIDLSFTKRGIIKSLTFLGGIGFSRVIAKEDGVYTPYFLNDDDEWVAYWNSSYLVGVRFPFRYGGKFDFSLGNDVFTSAGTFPAYSDIYFENDFSDRAENIDWSALINPKTADTASTSTTLNQTFKWKMANTVSPDVAALKPYLGTAKITKLDIELSWKSKLLPETAYEDYLPEGVDTTLDLPEKRFFYPDSLVLPNFSATISGIIFSTKKDTRTKEEERKAGIVPPEGMREPWRTETETTDAEARTDEEGKDAYRFPSPLPSVTIAKPKSAVPFTHSLSYQLTPSLSNTSTFNTDLWETPDDVDFSIQYSLLNLRGTATLTYQANLFESLVDFKNTLTFTANYDHHYASDTAVVDNWDSFEEKDLNATYLQLVDAVALGISPFRAYSLFQPTKLTYNLSTILYKGAYEEALFTNSFVDWTEDFITAHKVDLVLGVNQWGAKQTLSFQSTLPPIDLQLTPSLSLVTGPLASSLSTSMKQGDDEIWTFDPLVLKETLTFSTLFTLQQSIAYDIEESVFSTMSTTLSVKLFDSLFTGSQELSYDFAEETLTSTKTALALGPFTCSYQMKKTFPYTFDETSGWVRGDEMEFLPYLFSAGLKWDYKPDPFWKNRIRFSSSLVSTWNLDLIQFTDSSFIFNTSFKLKIKNLLDITFSSKSENKATFLYFEEMRDQLGISGEYSFIGDLLKSFNFFDISDRYASNFNLKTLSLKIVHHLHDWDLSFEYSGDPELTTNNDGIKIYEWTQSFTIMVQWNPIPEIKRSIVSEEGTITY